MIGNYTKLGYLAPELEYLIQLLDNKSFYNLSSSEKFRITNMLKLYGIFSKLDDYANKYGNVTVPQLINLFELNHPCKSAKDLDKKYIFSLVFQILNYKQKNIYKTREEAFCMATIGSCNKYADTVLFLVNLFQKDLSLKKLSCPIFEPFK